jgi:hypothetical protein
MVQRYDVVRAGRVIGSYLSKEYAESASRPTDVIRTQDTESIGHQYVVVEGKKVGEQFNKSSGGMHTVRRHVWQLKENQGLIEGIVYYRKVAYEMIYDISMDRWFHKETYLQHLQQT